MPLPLRLFLLALAALPLTGCLGSDGGGGSGGYTSLGLATWKERLEATPGAFLLDVRTAQEYQAGHLPNATLIPHTDIAQRAGELPADKATPIFVYCRTGNRSAIASEALVDLGYTNVVNLRDGGYPDWERAGYPVVHP